MNKVLIILGVAVIVIAAICFGSYVSMKNTEIKLRSSVEAKQKECEIYFDKMWKIINQKAQVAEKYKESFKDIYVPMIQGRYSNDKGGLMSWIQEHNPTFDASLYKDLSQAIEAQREGYFETQESLIDINREHHNYISTIPHSWFFDKSDEIDIKIITSEQTENVYKTGQENDVDLFK